MRITVEGASKRKYRVMVARDGAIREYILPDGRRLTQVEFDKWKEEILKPRSYRRRRRSAAAIREEEGELNKRVQTGDLAQTLGSFGIPSEQQLASRRTFGNFPRPFERSQ